MTISLRKFWKCTISNNMRIVKTDAKNDMSIMKAHNANL